MCLVEPDNRKWKGNYRTWSDNSNLWVRQERFWFPSGQVGEATPSSIRTATSAVASPEVSQKRLKFTPSCYDFTSAMKPQRGEEHSHTQLTCVCERERERENYISRYTKLKFFNQGVRDNFIGQDLTSKIQRVAFSLLREARLSHMMENCKLTKKLRVLSVWTLSTLGSHGLVCHPKAGGRDPLTEFKNHNISFVVCMKSNPL